MPDIAIRKALTSDFETVYALAKDTPELKVSGQFPFMEPNELKVVLTDPAALFLVAHKGSELAGFLYANTSDMEVPKNKWACLTYLVVDPHYRKAGIASKLLDIGLDDLKQRGITHIYGWASLSGDKAIVDFLKRRGFIEGHEYVWMDRKIN